MSDVAVALCSKSHARLREQRVVEGHPGGGGAGEPVLVRVRAAEHHQDSAAASVHQHRVGGLEELGEGNGEGGGEWWGKEEGREGRGENVQRNRTH